MDKQRSTKHTYKTKDRVTRTTLKTEDEINCPDKLMFYSYGPFVCFIYFLTIQDMINL